MARGQSGGSAGSGRTPYRALPAGKQTQPPGQRDGSALAPMDTSMTMMSASSSSAAAAQAAAADSKERASVASSSGMSATMGVPGSAEDKRRLEALQAELGVAQRTENMLEAVYVLRKQVQLEQTRLRLCSRLDAVRHEIERHEPGTHKDDVERLKQDVLFLRGLRQRRGACSIDEEYKVLIALMEKKRARNRAAGEALDMELGTHLRQLELLLSSDTARDPLAALRQEKEDELGLLSRIVMLASQAEQLKVEAGVLGSADFLERYKHFEAQVDELLSQYEELRRKPLGYESDVQLMRDLLSRLEQQEREAVSVRQMIEVLSSSAETMFTPRQQSQFESIVEHLTSSNIWRLFGQHGDSRADTVPAAQFKSLQDKYRLLRIEFDAFRERQLRHGGDVQQWMDKVASLRRKVRELKAQTPGAMLSATLKRAAATSKEDDASIVAQRHAAAERALSASMRSEGSASRALPAAATRQRSVTPTPAPSRASATPHAVPAPAPPSTLPSSMGAVRPSTPQRVSSAGRRSASASRAPAAVATPQRVGTPTRAVAVASSSPGPRPLSRPGSSGTDGAAAAAATSPQQLRHGTGSQPSIVVVQPPAGSTGVGSAGMPAAAPVTRSPSASDLGGSMSRPTALGALRAANASASSAASGAQPGPGVTLVAALTGSEATIRTMSLHPQGTLLATGIADASVRIWDLEKGRVVRSFAGHAKPIQEVRFHANGKILCSCADDGLVKFWNTSDLSILPDCVHELRVEHTPTCLTFSPDGRRLGVGSYKLLHFVDVETGTPTASMQAHAMNIYSCDYHPFENVIVTGGDDKLVKVWDLNSGKCVHSFTGHNSWVWRTRFSGDGNMVGSASQDHTVKLYDWRKAKQLFSWKHKDTVFGLHFAGPYVLSGGQDRTVRVVKAHTGETVAQMMAHSGTVYDIAYSGQLDTVVSAGADKTVRLWQFAETEGAGNA